ncbi:hypothetical protein HDU76_008247 [Blyttiomyces sp. JEL0837]|nr:hypothetical protein HDU76_008247 [Blyttiomyces sp. JEL0837]
MNNTNNSASSTKVTKSTKSTASLPSPSTSTSSASPSLISTSSSTNTFGAIFPHAYTTTPPPSASEPLQTSYPSMQMQMPVISTQSALQQQQYEQFYPYVQDHYNYNYETQPQQNSPFPNDNVDYYDDINLNVNMTADAMQTMNNMAMEIMSPSTSNYNSCNGTGNEMNDVEPLADQAISNETNFASRLEALERLVMLNPSSTAASTTNDGYEQRLDNINHLLQGQIANDEPVNKRLNDQDVNALKRVIVDGISPDQTFKLLGKRSRDGFDYNFYNYNQSSSNPNERLLEQAYHQFSHVAEGRYQYEQQQQSQQQSQHHQVPYGQYQQSTSYSYPTSDPASNYNSGNTTNDTGTTRDTNFVDSVLKAMSYPTELISSSTNQNNKQQVQADQFQFTTTASSNLYPYQIQSQSQNSDDVIMKEQEKETPNTTPTTTINPTDSFIALLMSNREFIHTVRELSSISSSTGSGSASASSGSPSPLPPSNLNSPSYISSSSSSSSHSSSFSSSSSNASSSRRSSDSTGTAMGMIHGFSNIGYGNDGFLKVVDGMQHQHQHQHHQQQQSRYMSKQQCIMRSGSSSFCGVGGFGGVGCDGASSSASSSVLISRSSTPFGGV